VIPSSADANESTKWQADRSGINRNSMFLDNSGAFQSPNPFIRGWRGEMDTLADLGIGRASILPQKA